MALPETLCLFPVYKGRAVYEHRTVFSVHTQNGTIADREEKFSEFDKKCIGLESYTAPLTARHIGSVTEHQLMLKHTWHGSQGTYYYAM